MPKAKVNTRLKQEIVRLRDSGMTYAAIGRELGLNQGTVRTHYNLVKGQPTAPRRIPESPWIKYDSPPELEGDALVLPDVEIPFHHAEFTNRVIDLAQAWGITQVIAAGDLMHMDSLSGWEPNWSTKETTILTERDEAILMDLAQTLPSKKQEALMQVIGNSANDGRDFSHEMTAARKALHALDRCFNKFVWVLGNHEGRLLRAINSPVAPTELLNLMNLTNGKWEIAPYYYAILNSHGETFRITHPKGAGDNAARALATQHHQHILMAHSHKMMIQWDPSGKYYAIQMGHMVDEERLAYAAQRDAYRNAHKLGAVIVFEGRPYLLNTHTDWEKMRNLPGA
jgi:hypothetical protein